MCSSPVQVEKHENNCNYNENVEEMEVRQPTKFEQSSSNFSQRDTYDGNKNDVGGSPMLPQ